MKQLFFALLIAISSSAHAELFTAKSKTFGVPFDLTVTEVTRESRSSIVRVANFYQRSAPATRWMMCMLNTLAILRGYDYWTVVYPDPNSNEPEGEVIVGFPRAQTERLSDSDSRFGSKHALPQVIPVDRGASLCMAYRSANQGAVSRRGSIGIVMQEMTKDLAKALGFDGTGGILVSAAKVGSSAAVAGIKSGDIILRLNEQVIQSTGSFLEMMATIEPGAFVTLDIWRHGVRNDVSVAVKELEQR